MIEYTVSMKNGKEIKFASNIQIPLLMIADYLNVNVSKIDGYIIEELESEEEFVVRDYYGRIKNERNTR